MTPHKAIVMAVCTFYAVLALIELYQVITGNFTRRPTVTDTFIAMKMIIHTALFVALWCAI